MGMLMKGVNLSAYGIGFFRQIKGFMAEAEHDILTLEDIQYFIDAAIRQSEYLKLHPDPKAEIKKELIRRGCRTCGDKNNDSTKNTNQDSKHTIETVLPLNYYEYGLDIFFESSIELYT